jgi:histidine ammonia-lyase
VAPVAPILAELAEEDVDWLLATGERQSVPRGTVLIEAGLPAPALFVVVDGVVGIEMATLLTARLVRRGRGELVGEMSFVDSRPPSATVTALEDSVVYALPREAVAAKLALDAGFSARFHRAVTVFLSDRIRELMSPDADAAAAAPLAGNTHLANARLERLIRRLPQKLDVVVLTGNDLTVESVVRVARARARVDLGPHARSRVERSRATVDALAHDTSIYGVNLGLGALQTIGIAPEANERFQQNILKSHAVGVGPEYDVETVRAIMIARINGMARGGSGVHPGVVDLLIAMLNEAVHPIVPSRGSIGMSDLSPLAHLALPLIGLGEVEFDGTRMTASEALARAGLEPVRLSGKDALALCSANSAAVGHGTLVIAKCIDLLACADVAAALSLEALAARLDSLSAQVHEARPYSGQLATAERLRALLEGSHLWESTSGRVHAPLSFRCVPQVHGAVSDALAHGRRTLETELNSSGDNPLVVPEWNAVLPNGNFHPAGLSITFDTLAIALAQVMSMAVNRVLRLMTPALSDLPSQLTPDPGPNCGLGALQKTVTALNAEARFLASPASLDFVPVANSIEDHATMATLSVRKADQLLDCLRHALAIELLCSAQAIDLRPPPRLGQGTGAAYDAVRTLVPFLPEDEVLAPFVASIAEAVTTGDVLDAVNAATSRRFGLDLA